MMHPGMRAFVYVALVCLPRRCPCPVVPEPWSRRDCAANLVAVVPICHGKCPFTVEERPAGARPSLCRRGQGHSVPAVMCLRLAGGERLHSTAGLRRKRARDMSSNSHARQDPAKRVTGHTPREFARAEDARRDEEAGSRTGMDSSTLSYTSTIADSGTGGEESANSEAESGTAAQSRTSTSSSLESEVDGDAQESSSSVQDTAAPGNQECRAGNLCSTGAHCAFQLVSKLRYEELIREEWAFISVCQTARGGRTPAPLKKRKVECLTSSQQVKEIRLQQEPWAVAVGPDGLLYVSMALMCVCFSPLSRDGAKSLAQQCRPHWSDRCAPCFALPHSQTQDLGHKPAQRRRSASLPRTWHPFVLARAGPGDKHDGRRGR